MAVEVLNELGNERLKAIKAIAFDVDGVMTDGLMIGMPDGDLLRLYDAKDCFGIRMAAMAGYVVSTITGGASVSIKKRMMLCGVKEEDCYLHSRIKMEQFEDLCRRHGLKPEEVMYFGDDLPDVPVMEACGIAVAPADAVQEAKDAADFISPRPGGKGCVRHAIETLLKSQDKWHLDTQKYKSQY